MKALLSVLIFVIAYIFVATEKINKTVVVILGASLVLFLRLVTFQDAVAAVDFNVIFLLVGMMTCVYILSRTGFFEWIAVSVAKHTHGNPYLIMMWMMIVTVLLSAVLDNVTTIILLVPVTILIMQLLELPPAPFIIMEVIASNIGGAATLIGDPPNIIIGSQANLSFNQFLINLGPIISVVFIVFLVTALLMFRSRFAVPAAIKKRVEDAVPKLAIVDYPNMVRSLTVLLFIFIGFFFHDMLDLRPGVIALCGSMVMMLVCRVESDETLMRVEWGVIFFFIGMFIMIAAMEANGVIAQISSSILHLAGHNLFMVCILILWGSAILSSVLDNIPFVIAMIPLIKRFMEHFSQAGSPVDIQPLWWALALGACLGGNGTLIGASANIIMARIAAKNKCPVTFGRFFKYGALFMVQSMLICTLYLWLRYFS